MIHFVASGPSVLTTWNNSFAHPGDIVCAISGAARYVREDLLDWWCVADRHTQYSALLDPPYPMTPNIGYLCDTPSASSFHGCGKRVEIHDQLWPVNTRRRFSAPCAAMWMLQNYPDHQMMCYGVDLDGDQYAWREGPEIDVPESLTERWAIERAVWAIIHTRYHHRILGLPLSKLPFDPLQEIADLAEAERLKEERAQELGKRLDYLLTSVNLIRAHAGVKSGKHNKPAHDVRGEIGCPMCLKTMNYIITAHDNHVAAECLTPCCQNFTE